MEQTDSEIILAIADKDQGAFEPCFTVMPSHSPAGALPKRQTHHL